MQTPKFLQELLSSPEYGDKNSETYRRATKYMNILYPGTVQFDASGRMMRPEYDMTLKQFNAAQAEIDADFEAEKDDATEEVMEDFEDYFENIGFDFNIEDYVVSGDPIPVKVLMPGGYISKRQLDTYELDIPEFKIAPKIWRWHSSGGENTCDECESRDGTVYFFQTTYPYAQFMKTAHAILPKKHWIKTAKQSLRKITRQIRQTSSNQREGQTHQHLKSR